MGLYSDAALIYGIAVETHDDEGRPTQHWDEDADDFREFEDDYVNENIEYRTYGHYEDPEGHRAILAPKKMKAISGDCWEPTEVPLDELYVRDKAISKAADAARVAGLDVDFYGEAKWYLVASYG